jgi:gliding motility-associated-like protein
MKARLKPFSFFLVMGIFLYLTTSFQSMASAISGADLTYKYLEPNTYEVTLYYYYNCDTNEFPPSNAAISVSSVSCNIPSSTQYLPIIFAESNEEMSVLCDNYLNTGQNTSCNGGSYLGIKRYVYRGTITLVDACNDWRLSFTDDSWYSGITNLANPSQHNLYIEAMINNSNGIINNSPNFVSIPTAFFCLTPSVFDQGIIESDGDELTFSVVNPLENGNLPIPYQAGYSNTAPLLVSIYSFDNGTGQIKFTPSAEQLSVVSVLIEERRNGVLIGTTLRNLQLSVLNCANEQASIQDDAPEEITVCAGSLFQTNFTINNANNLLLYGEFIDSNNFVDLNWIYNTATNPIEGTFSCRPRADAAGKYYFVVKIAQDACPFSTTLVKTYVVNVLPNPNAYINPSINVCKNTTSLLSIDSTAINNTYFWQPAIGLSCTDCANPNVTVSEDTEYSVIVTNDLGCQDTLQTYVLVQPSPSVDAGLNQIITNGEIANLAATGNFDSIKWLPAAGVDNPNMANTVVNVSQTTSFVAVASLANGCTATDTVLISYKNCEELLVPTAFSPNNDEKNDVFRIPQQGINSIINLTIYDRWGNNIFETDDATQTWDGTRYGKNLPIGTYTYVCTYTCNDKTEMQKGFLVLIK